MITYNPAFDLYHCVFRMAHILQHIEETDIFEVDKARIWDFYLLFPDKVYDITIRRNEQEIRQLRKQYIKRKNNPYDYDGDDHKLFERLKPFQMTALSCLVSYGIIDRDSYLNKKIHLLDKTKLDKMLEEIGNLEIVESNTLSFLSHFSKNMSLYGLDGLKSRTKLMESRYDAE